MVLRRIENTPRPPGPLVGRENWVPPVRRMFMGSQPFEILQRDLRRYVDGTVLGRAFLIAGHRGAGKTTLMLRAIADLRDEILLGEVNARMRPLMVKLHGPTLVSGRPPAKQPRAREDEPDHQAGQQGPIAIVNINTDPAKAEPPPGGGAGDQDQQALDKDRKALDEDQEAREQAALIHITVALYRALAEEVSWGFRNHVLAAAPGNRSRRILELAAVLKLELDRGAGPDVLRGFWRRMNRLQNGTLWPTPPDDRGRKSDTSARGRDQGMLEIVALATAAQAFQVCIGDVSSSNERRDAGSAQESTEHRMSLDLAPVVNRLLGLLGGAALGTGLAVASGDIAKSAAAGVLAGLVGAVALSWNGKSARERNENAAYRFIRDYSLATLDRDLPHIIHRVREAGLAPVFVVDELDKIELPKNNELENAPRDAVSMLINRFKSLTTDNAFFAFLVDREYYEKFLGRLAQSSYGPDYTYFSHWLYLTYDSGDELAFLLQATTCEPDRLDALDWMTFVFAARLEARGNNIALVRQLDRDFMADGRLNVARGGVRENPYFRLRAAMQIAFDEALSDKEMVKQRKDKHNIGPLALDALYLIAKSWEDDLPEVDLTNPALITKLKVRGGSVEQLSDDTKEFLSQWACRTAGKLASFQDLHALAEAFWTKERVEAIFPRRGLDPAESLAVAHFGAIAEGSLVQGVDGIVAEIDDRPGVFRFLVDRYGVKKPLPPLPPVAAAAPLALLPSSLNAPLIDPARPERELAAADDTALRGREVDPFASARTPPDAVGEAARDIADDPLGPARNALAQAHALLNAFANRFTVGIDLLMQVGALPPNLPLDSSFAAMLAAVEKAIGAGDPATLPTNDMQAMVAFLQATQARANAIAWVAIIAISIGRTARDAGRLFTQEGTSPSLDMLSRTLIRHIELPGNLPSDPPPTLAGIARLTGIDVGSRDADLPRRFELDVGDIERWRDDIAGVAAKVSLPAFASDSAWYRWRPAMIDFVENTEAALPSVTLSELAAAARGIGPAARLSRVLADVTVLDWSDLAIAASIDPPAAEASEPEAIAVLSLPPLTDAPAWVCRVALVVLGFGQEVVAMKLDRPEDAEFVRVPRGSDLSPAGMLTGAAFRRQDAIRQKSPARPNVLLVLSDAAGQIAAAPLERRGFGVLAVRKADLAGRARPLIARLRESEFKLVPAYI